MIDFPADYEIAIELVLKQEGGYVNNPADSGGATNYGITERTLSEYRKHTRSTLTIPTLTKADAKEFYYLEFWIPMRLVFIYNQPLKNVLLATGINLGKRVAIRKLQSVLRIPTDGIIGLQTATAAQYASVNAYCDEIKLFYEQLVRRKPQNVVFLKGWKNRINSYRIA